MITDIFTVMKMAKLVRKMALATLNFVNNIILIQVKVDAIITVIVTSQLAKKLN